VLHQRVLGCRQAPAKFLATAKQLNARQTQLIHTQLLHTLWECTHAQTQLLGPFPQALPLQIQITDVLMALLQLEDEPVHRLEICSDLHLVRLELLQRLRDAAAPECLYTMADDR